MGERTRKSHRLKQPSEGRNTVTELVQGCPSSKYQGPLSLISKYFENHLIIPKMKNSQILKLFKYKKLGENRLKYHKKI